MVDSVNALTLVDRRAITEAISEHLVISVGTVHNIEHNYLAFSKVSSTRNLQGFILLQEQWKQFFSLIWNCSHIPLSPNLVLSDFYLFGFLSKNFCVEQSFQAMMTRRAPWANG